VKIGTDPASPTLASLKNTNTALYNTVKKRLADLRAVLPPSAGMAGVYARVDRERGVWKAPANVGLMSVIGPVEQISADAQERLNVDANSGKSINAIRAFPGRGTLVWGARTLAGNDNEWRYVPVRRLFIMIEESARKSSAFAVFEPNDATTWLKVKGMLDSYLFSLWEQGALQGSTPETAFYVNVGLGKTMSAQDVLEGRLIVEIGIAAVRPAEFIVLRFSHKLAEA
jgi:phage tail sheath protein FI